MTDEGFNERWRAQRAYDEALGLCTHTPTTYDHVLWQKFFGQGFRAGVWLGAGSTTFLVVVLVLALKSLGVI